MHSTLTRTNTDTAQRHEPVASATPGKPRYRGELQGLRALAVLLVVAYHVWFDRVSGGVDVFFVITGFLIVGQLFRASQRGRIRFRTTWARIIKRLFPAALTVLVAVMVASLVWLPEHRWLQTIKEAAAAALYFENWLLTASSTDYFAQHNTASVVQHFWSLSIQGQFYLLMPLVVALVAMLARRAGWDMRRALLTTLATLFTFSLAYSVWLTETDQALAYFNGLTRVWEFMLGGMLALVADAIALPRRVRIVLGWVGVAALVSCGMVLQVGTMFPGYAALWPTLAAVLVLVAGSTDSTAGADRWLSSRPLKFVGDISYALYLWHWPVLVLYLTANRQDAVTLDEGLALIAASFLFAVATHYLVEEPARKSIGVTTSWGAYRFGVAMLVAAMTVAGSWLLFSVQRVEAHAVTLSNTDRPGALVRTDPDLELARYPVDPGPSLIALQSDFAELPSDCADSELNDDLRICSTPDAERATKRIVVVGDSHAQQNLAAIMPIAERRGWQVISMIGGGCAFSYPDKNVRMTPACQEVNPARLTEIKRLKPDAVVTMGSYRVMKGRTESTPRGFVKMWRKLDDAGIPVAAIRDHPRFTYHPARCAMEFGVDAPECREPRKAFYGKNAPYERAAIPGNVGFIDLTPYYCDDTQCRPVIGNVWVYMDPIHVSASYMSTLQPVVERELETAAGW